MQISRYHHTRVWAHLRPQRSILAILYYFSRLFIDSSLYLVPLLHSITMKIIYSTIMSLFMLLLTKPTIGKPVADDTTLDSKKEESVKRAFPIGTNPSNAPFLIKNQNTGTSVGISVSGLRPELLVVYPVYPKGLTYTDIQVWVGSVRPPLDVTKYPYTTGGDCFVEPAYSIAQCHIPIGKFTNASRACGKTFNIVTRAEMNNSRIGTAGDKCIRSSCSPWFKYWTFTFTC